MAAESVLVLLALTAVLGAALAVVARQPAPLMRRLLVVLAIALALRVSLGVALHLSGAWQITSRGAVTPDEAIVDYAARLRLAGDPRSPVELGGSLHTAWLLVTTAVYELWNSLLAVKLLNAALGSLLVVPTFLLARDLHSVRAGVCAAWGVALLPTAIVWSALALREPLIALTLTTLAVTLLRLLRSPAPRRAAVYVLFSAAALLVLGFTRSYMVPLMMALLVGGGLVAAAEERRLRPVVAALLVTAVAASAITAMPRGVELVRATAALTGDQAPTIYNPFSDCSDESSCLAEDSGSTSEALAPEQGPTGRAMTERGDARSPAARPAEPDLTESLQSVGEKGFVRAFAIAVLAGRPVWLTRDFFFLLQPGVVVWWAALPLVAVGSVHLLVRRRLTEAVLLVGFCASVVVFLAYSGQFIRHHFMIEPVAVSLAAVGARWALEAPSRCFSRATAAAIVFMALAACASVLLSLA